MKDGNKYEITSAKTTFKSEINQNVSLGIGLGPKSSTWCIDSGASAHMCWNKQLFHELKEGRVGTVIVGNGQRTPIMGLIINSTSDPMEVKLTDVMYPGNQRESLLGTQTNHQRLLCNICQRNVDQNGKKTTSEFECTMEICSDYLRWNETKENRTCYQGMQSLT